MAGERPTPPEVATTPESLRTQLAALQHEEAELEKEFESAQSKSKQISGLDFEGQYREIYQKNFGTMGFPVHYTRDERDTRLKDLQLGEKDMEKKHADKNFSGRIQCIVNAIDSALQIGDPNEDTAMAYDIKKFLSQLKETLASPDSLQKAEAIDARNELSDKINSLVLRVREVIETAKSSSGDPSSLRERIFPKERTDLNELESWINEKLLRLQQIGVPVKGFER